MSCHESLVIQTILFNMLDHSLHAFSGKCPETPNLTHVTKSKWHQKDKNQKTMTKIYSVLEVDRIHQHAKFQAIPSMRSPGNARKPQIWPVSLSQNSTKIRKTTDHDYNIISFEGGRDTSACKMSGYSLHAFSGICPESYPDGQAKKTVTVGGMDQQTNVQFERGYFGLWTDGRTDGRTDGQPKNIMPPAHKLEDITNHVHDLWDIR